MTSHTVRHSGSLCCVAEGPRSGLLRVGAVETVELGLPEAQLRPEGDSRCQEVESAGSLSSSLQGLPSALEDVHYSN